MFKIDKRTFVFIVLILFINLKTLAISQYHKKNNYQKFLIINNAKYLNNIIQLYSPEKINSTYETNKSQINNKINFKKISLVTFKKIIKLLALSKNIEISNAVYFKKQENKNIINFSFSIYKLYTKKNFSEKIQLTEKVINWIIKKNKNRTLRLKLIFVSSKEVSVSFYTKVKMMKNLLNDFKRKIKVDEAKKFISERNIKNDIYYFTIKVKF